ncbi:MAG: hypothetical protein AAF512_15060, partial [Pseudomonadota bacterium]
GCLGERFSGCSTANQSSLSIASIAGLGCKSVTSDERIYMGLKARAVTIGETYISDTDYLLNYIRHWPPQTSEEKNRAFEAKKITHIRKFVKSHWLYKELFSTYEESIRNDLLNHVDSSSATIAFSYNPPSSWLKNFGFWTPRINYRFDERGNLKKMQLSGEFRAFYTGELKKMLSEVKEILDLNRVSGDFKIFIEAEVVDQIIEGSLIWRTFEGISTPQEYRKAVKKKSYEKKIVSFKVNYQLEKFIVSAPDS